MLVTTDALMNYLFNFLFIFLMLFIGALINDITDTIRNQTKIRIISSMVDSFVCTVALIILKEQFFNTVSTGTFMSFTLIIGYNSEWIVKILNKICKGDKVLDLLLSIIIKDEELKQFIIDGILDKNDNNNEDDKK